MLLARHHALRSGKQADTMLAGAVVWGQLMHWQARHVSVKRVVAGRKPGFASAAGWHVWPEVTLSL